MSIFSRTCRWARPRSRARRGFHFLRGGWAARALILTYHRVVPETGSDPFGLKTTATHFEAQLKCLRRSYPVVGLDDLVEQVRSGKSRHWRQVSITFDDGYADNHHHAAPLLREHGMPAAFYLTADYIDSGRPFWWDELHALIRDHQGMTLLVNGAIGQDYRLTDAKDRREALGQLCGRLRRVPADQREEVIAGLQPHGRPVAGEEDRPMTWDEARSLTEQGFTVGAHSRRHPSLGSLTASQVREEVEESKAILEGMLQREVRHFSYPHDDGDHHRRAVSATAREAVRQAGFVSAVSVISGVNEVGQDLYSLRRLTVRDWDEEEFGRQVDDTFRYGY